MDEKRHNELIRRAIEESLPVVRLFAKGLCLNDSVADDLVQSACERALRRIDQVYDISGVSRWMNRIVYTTWHDILRKRQVRKQKMNEIAGTGTIYGTHPTSRGDEQLSTRMDLAAALARLPDDQRAVVVLVSMMGYGYHEAAEILELPVGTVASRVARARIRLAEQLKDIPRN